MEDLVQLARVQDPEVLHAAGIGTEHIPNEELGEDEQCNCVRCHLDAYDDDEVGCTDPDIMGVCPACPSRSFALGAMTAEDVEAGYGPGSYFARAMAKDD